MTKKEEQTFEKIAKLITDINTENQKFRIDINKQIELVTEKIKPVQFEQNILSTAQQAIGKAIGDALTTSYDSPLKKLVNSVINENTTELKNLISDSFTSVIRTTEFKQSIINAFSHKIAKTIISNNDGLFDKVSNELKQDNVFKS